MKSFEMLGELMLYRLNLFAIEFEYRIPNDTTIFKNRSNMYMCSSCFHDIQWLLNVVLYMHAFEILNL